MATKIVILGAGITGLTTAWKLLKSDGDFEITLLERENLPGGLAKTIFWKGYALDLGPHRFHTEIPEIREFVRSFCEEKMVRVKRSSRMYINGSYIPYPISPVQTFKALGIGSSLSFMISALQTLFDQKPEKAESYEEYVQSYYGKALYQRIFKPFAQKVWGIEPSQIAAETARVRLRGENIWHALKDSLFSGEETYVSEFLYPHGGIGEIPRKFAQEIVSLGGDIIIGQTVDQVQIESGKISRVLTSGMHGAREFECDYVVSTIPLPDLVNLIDPQPSQAITNAANQLQFRALVLLYLLFDTDLGITDTWLYYPEDHVPFSRIYVPDNFSTWMEKRDNTCLCLEFPCQIGDEIWTGNKESLQSQSLDILLNSELIDRSPADSLAVHIEEGYPLYKKGYEQFRQTILDWLNSLENCLTTGRQGLFRHNNIDQAMQMGLKAAEHIASQPVHFNEWYDKVSQFNDYRIVD